MIEREQPNEKKAKPETASLRVKNSYLDLLPLPILLLVEASLTASSIFNLAQANVRFKDYLKTFSYWEKRFPSLSNKGHISAEDIAAMKQKDANGLSLYLIFLNMFHEIEDQVRKEKLLLDLLAVENAEDILERLKYFEKNQIPLTEKDLEKLEQHCVVAPNNYLNFAFIKNLAKFVIEALEDKSYDLVDRILENKNLKRTILINTDHIPHDYYDKNNNRIQLPVRPSLAMPLLKDAVKRNDEKLIKYLLKNKLLDSYQLVNDLIGENDLDTLKALVPSYIELPIDLIRSNIDNQLSTTKNIESIQTAAFFLSLIENDSVKTRERNKIREHYLFDILLKKDSTLLNELYKSGILDPKTKYEFIYAKKKPTLFNEAIDSTTYNLSKLTPLHLAILVGDVDKIKQASEADLKDFAEINVEHEWGDYDYIGDYNRGGNSKHFSASPLQLAIIFYSPEEVITALLDKGADVTKTNSLGHTASDVAKEIRGNKVRKANRETNLRNSFLLARQTFLKKNNEYKAKRCKEGKEITVNGVNKNYKNYLDITLFGRPIFTKGFGDDLKAKEFASGQLTKYMLGEIPVEQVPEAAKRGELGNIFYEFEAARKSFRQP